MLEKTGKVRSGSKTKTRVRVVEDGRARVKSDHLATEEPMEIRLVTGGKRQTVAVTMRTPGPTSSSRPGSFTGRASSPPAMR
jgi:FdhD protein